MTNVMYVMTKSKYMTFSIHQMIEDQPRPRVSQALFTLLMDAREFMICTTAMSSEDPTVDWLKVT